MFNLVQEPDTPPRSVPEVVVQDLWRFQYFRQDALRTTCGQPCTVLAPGRLNTGPGPDFLEARIQLGGLTWFGDVEIHSTSSGWTSHGHHHDPAYNRVVLHVVLETDRQTGPLLRNDGTSIPELALYPHLQSSLRSLIHAFYHRTRRPFPCADSWAEVPLSVRQNWIQTLGQQRLLQKAARFESAYQVEPDLETLLYRELFRGLGYVSNAQAMYDLAERVPIPTLRSLESSEERFVYLFNASGLSETTRGDSKWSRSGLRPANHPVTRLLQGVRWFEPGGLFFQNASDALVTVLNSPAPLDAFYALLRPGPASEPASIGKQRLDTLLMNTVLPFLISYSRLAQRPEWEAAVFRLAETVGASHDRVVRPYVDRDYPLRHGLDHQGLHHLSRNWCHNARCLSCPVGKAVLAQSESLSPASTDRPGAGSPS